LNGTTWGNNVLILHKYNSIFDEKPINVGKIKKNATIFEKYATLH